VIHYGSSSTMADESKFVSPLGKGDRTTISLSCNTFTRTHESRLSEHNFGACRIGIAKSKNTLLVKTDKLFPG
jgi:hypothetical protein